MTTSKVDQNTPEADGTPQPESAQGFEGSAERDAQSHQTIGKHSPEVERQIGERMADRK